MALGLSWSGVGPVFGSGSRYRYGCRWRSLSFSLSLSVLHKVVEHIEHIEHIECIEQRWMHSICQWDYEKWSQIIVGFWIRDTRPDCLLSCSLGWL